MNTTMYSVNELPNGDIVMKPFDINLDNYERKELEDGEILYEKLNIYEYNLTKLSNTILKIV